MREGDVRHGIFLTHRSTLIEYATPIVGSRDLAEDVVQDAFLKLTPANIRGDSNEQTLAYLYRIVRNLAFDLLRRRQMEKRHTGNDIPYWAIPRETVTPEQAVLYCDEIRVVSEVLASLPTEVRVAVEMHRFGEFTFDEISKHLNISVATAHRHVKSTMLKIALRLDKIAH